MKIKNIILSLVALFFVSSCYEDLGNYDYKQLNEPKIVLSQNEPDLYTVYRADTLSIPMTVNYSGDPKNLEYLWYLYQKDGQVQSKYVTIDTIGYEKDLKVPITASPESYTLVFEVKDTTTGIKDFTKLSLSVQTLAGVGWMVLHGTENSCDFDIIVTRDINPLAIEEKTIRNIYSLFNGKQLKGKPMQIFWHSTAKRIRIFTDQEAVALETIEYLKIAEYEEFFYEKPDVLKFEGYTANGRNELIVNNGDLYCINGGTTPNDWKFGFKQLEVLNDPNNVRDFYINPNLPKTGAYGAWGLVFDQKNHRFLKLPQYSVNLSVIPPPYALDYPFMMDNIEPNLELLSMESGPLAGSGFWRYYCVFRDKLTRYTFLYILNAHYPSSSTNRYPQSLNLMSEETPEADNALFFQMSSAANVFFYATDKKVFIYDYLNNNGADSGFVPDNPSEIITSMKLLKYYKTYSNDFTPIPVNVNKLLFVATFNPSTGEGKVYAVPANISNGTLDLTGIKVYRGFKRIYDMSPKLS